MDEGAFRRLRDLPGKTIRSDIKFARKKSAAPLLVAEGIAILNSEGRSLSLSIHYNPEVGSKTFNVHLAGVGPICRLDVDGRVHRDAGRCHKHALVRERCPARNLPHAVAVPEFTGLSLREVFAAFCERANILHVEGDFEAVDEET